MPTSRHPSGVICYTLVRCPFCGSKPQVQKWHGGGPQKRLISCINERCPANPGVTGETPTKAARAWNRRSARGGEKVNVWETLD